MTKSALQIARAAYQPKLPKALASGAVKAVADRKSTRLNSSHTDSSRMPSSA